MLLRLAQFLYLLTSSFALTLIVTAMALAFDIYGTSHIELYVVSAMMVAAAIAIGLFGRAVYRWAR
jgi:hypothetical protein